jgi:stage III sporulation protein AG
MVLDGIFKKLFEGKSRKRVIQNIILIVILALVAVLMGNSIFNEGKKDADAAINETSLAEDLEKRVEEFLKTIEGVGRVRVIITYESTEEKVLAYEKRETMSDLREETDTSIVFEGGYSESKKPVVLKNLYPQIKGIAVAAEGADNDYVRMSIMKTIEVLCDVPLYKIYVNKMK